MQQFSSKHQKMLAEALANARNQAPGLNMGPAPSPVNPISGIFGSGQVRFYTATQNFIVPAGCTRIRARGWSPGGKATKNLATGEITTTTGGTVSFGSHFSITGGSAGTSANPGAGGVATGGDVNHSGGSGSGLSGGGGASLLGPGDFGGAGRGGNSGLTGRAGQGLSVHDTYGKAEDGETGRSDCIDFIGTGGGGGNAAQTSGATATEPGHGSNGGGGGAQIIANPVIGRGGFPAGGDGGGIGNAGSATRQGSGGGGFSMKDIAGLTPGSTIVMTIPTGGLIIVEW